MYTEIDYKIRDNMGLIYRQINKFHLRSDPEALSIGYEAMYSAIKTFDETKDIRFSTYACVCIYNALGSYIRTLNKVRQLDVVSYNNKTVINGTELEIIEILPSSFDVAQAYERKELCKRVREVHIEVCSQITNDRQLSIIEAWKDSNYVATKVEIAELVGVSQPYVSQILAMFKSKVKTKMEEYYE